jgi:hypothetical protein
MKARTPFHGDLLDFVYNFRELRDISPCPCLQVKKSSLSGQVSVSQTASNLMLTFNKHKRCSAMHVTIAANMVPIHIPGLISPQTEVLLKFIYPKKLFCNKGRKSSVNDKA